MSPVPSAQADARQQHVGDIVRESDLGQDAVAALNDIAQRMLSSARGDLLAHALRRIFDVVPTAQRVTVVAWPPDPGRGFVPLVDEEILRREGIPESPVSTSMARHAVDARQALYFLGQSDTHEDIRRAPSVLANRIHSAVYVPLLGEGDEVMALLCVDTPRPAVPIAPGDFPFIRAVGALLASALRADRIRQEAQRQELAARDQQARRDALADCMRVASHDLKSPLVVIQLAAHLMARTAEPEERDVFLEQIQRAVARSTRLIRTYLEALAIPRRFDYSHVPHLLSAYHADETYKQLSRREVREIFDQLLDPGLIFWNTTQLAYTIHDSTRHILLQYLKATQVNRWRRLHIACVDLYQAWIDGRSRNLEQWQAELEYHKDELRL